MGERIQKKVFQIWTGLLVLAAILALDFGIKLAHSAWVAPPATPPTAHRVANSFYHHGLAPNAAVTENVAGLEYPFFSNSLGLRDARVRTISLRKSGPRILFIGDSFTEGIGLPWEEAFVGRVQASLAPEGVEVLNAGVNSYTPLLIKQRLIDLIVKQEVEVDRVVVLLDISDVLQELQYRETEDGSVRSIPYAPFEDRAAELDRANRLQDWMEKNLENRFILLGAVSRNLRLWFRSHDEACSLWDRRWDWAWRWPDYQGPFRPLIDRGLDLAAANMGVVSDMLKSRGIGLTVVVYPYPQQLGPSAQPNEAERFWGEWSSQHGADFVSLYPRFRELGSAPEVQGKYYFPKDSHWNAAGHAEVAQTLLGPFRSLILPPKSPSQSP